MVWNQGPVIYRKGHFPGSPSSVLRHGLEPKSHGWPGPQMVFILNITCDTAPPGLDNLQLAISDSPSDNRDTEFAFLPPPRFHWLPKGINNPTSASESEILHMHTSHTSCSGSPTPGTSLSDHAWTQRTEFKGALAGRYFGKLWKQSSAATSSAHWYLRYDIQLEIPKSLTSKGKMLTPLHSS